ncbi:hypothetical protein, partial [Aquiflexum lacus]|uniref:hypothetical protein n=1 Tax=Aquiflexum lacus TaxID=2483805 RepID=UPI00189539CB
SVLIAVSPASTKAVVAIWVVLVPSGAVGAIGIPDNSGDADKTTFPVPVTGLDTRPFEPSVNTGKDSFKEESTGCAVRVVTPVTFNV